MCVNKLRTKIDIVDQDRNTYGSIPELFWKYFVFVVVKT